MDPSSLPSSLPPSTTIPPTTITTTGAAMEVLRLVVYVSDMWSRHRDSLRAMACGGEIGVEEARVVKHLGHELRGLWEMMIWEDDDEELQQSWSSSDDDSDGNDSEEKEWSQVSLTIPSR